MIELDRVNRSNFWLSSFKKRNYENKMISFRTKIFALILRKLVTLHRSLRRRFEKQTLSASDRNKSNVYIHAAEISEANQSKHKMYRETPPNVQGSQPSCFNVNLFISLLFTKQDIAVYTCYHASQPCNWLLFQRINRSAFGTRYASRCLKFL